MKKRIYVLSLLTLSTITFNSCSEKKQDSTETNASGILSERPENPEDTEQTLLLESDDNMQFLQTEFKVRVNEPINLTLKHVGTKDKEQMGHNFVLVKPGTDLQLFAIRAESSKDNEYIPKDSKEIIIHTRLLGGGEEETITFTLTKADTYNFICTFPGHSGIMKGKITAE